MANNSVDHNFTHICVISINSNFWISGYLEIDVDKVLVNVKEKYAKQPVNTVDGVKIEFDKEWVHLRKSNTEPIIRIYSESESVSTADALAKKLLRILRKLLRSKNVPQMTLISAESKVSPEKMAICANAW